MKKLLFVVVLVLGLALAACGGGDAGGETDGGDAVAAVGDAAAGEALFAQTIIVDQAGCATCHSLEPDVVIVGPSMAGIASRASSTIAGLSAEDYIRQSILAPNDYIVEGYPAGVMVPVWEETLTEEELDNLVAYLLTLN